MKANGVVLALFVDDYDVGLRFYTETLGLFDVVADTHVSEDRRYVCIALSKHVDKFMLQLKKPDGGPACSLIGKQAGDEVLLTLPIDDAEKLHSELAQKDVAIEAEIEWLPYGGGFFVTDPYGNRISLFQRFVSRFDS